jgi:hypothetical protein
MRFTTEFSIPKLVAENTFKHASSQTKGSGSQSPSGRLNQYQIMVDCI